MKTNSPEWWAEMNKTLAERFGALRGCGYEWPSGPDPDRESKEAWQSREGREARAVNRDSGRGRA